MESEAKVKGTLKYLADIKIPGMLHCKVLRSPTAHATIRSIDASRAAALPGVVGVLTRDDVIGNPNYESHYGPVLMDQTIVALDNPAIFCIPIGFLGCYLGTKLSSEHDNERQYEELYVRSETGLGAEAAGEGAAKPKPARKPAEHSPEPVG